MAEARKPTQRYLSGRVKIAGTEALSDDRHLYVEPGQVEPNLGYVGERDIPISDKYYNLVTIPNGDTGDRYWQEISGLEPGGITVFDEGIQVSTANSITKLDFVGLAVTATASGSISTITISNNAQVFVGENPPPNADNGDLWWDSGVGELFVFYDDEVGTPSAQWVETSGGSETVTISENAPPSPNPGDLWWKSDTARLFIRYEDADSSQWVDAASGILDNVVNFWTKNSTGIHTLGNVGVGTTNAVGIASTTNTSILNAGIVTAVTYYGDGSNLTGIDFGGSGGKWVQNSSGIHTLSAVGVGTTNPLSPVHPDNNTIFHAGIVTANKYFGDGSGLAGVGGTVGIGTTAPPNPDPGDLWWNSGSGQLAIYYDDGFGSPSDQWVEVAEGPMGRQGSQGVQGAPGSGSQGVQGHQGVQGNQGVQGAAGSGSQGVQGNQGHQGVQGAQGAAGSGSQGVQGALGAQGNQGHQGIPGSGSQGVQGGSGLQGHQGHQGHQGVQGAAGQQGNQGHQGVQGAQGHQGVQGAAGQQGNQGHQGVQGAQGVQGNQGFGGVGTQGAQGAQGHQGVQGADGAQGDPGVQGHQGVQGAQGAQGHQGVQGAAGQQGNQGHQGVQGAQGAPGVQGAQGAAGDDGLQGHQGRQGAAGQQGNQGHQGVQGAQGAAGNGDQGDKGGLRYTFNTSTSSNATASGEVRFDNATFGSINFVGLHNTDADGTDLETYLKTWDDGGNDQDRGTIIIKSNTNSDSTIAIFRIGDIDDGNPTGTRTRYGVTPLSGSIPSNGEELVVEFIRTGNTGAQGVQGTAGVQGAQGAPGAQGAQGAPGAQGAQGAPGAQGAQGAAGVQGAQGSQGRQGAQGRQGSQGHQGVQGTAGGAGQQGNQGHQGVQGDQGLTGLSGQDGVQGHQGVQGSSGEAGPGNSITVSATTDSTCFPILAGSSGAGAKTPLVGDQFTFNESNGSFTATGNVTAFSDLALKEDIEIIENALEKVCSIRGITYTRKDTGAKETGVIAQEVEKILPEAVHDVGKDPIYKAVAYGNLIGLVIEAIKELKGEIDELGGKK